MTQLHQSTTDNDSVDAKQESLGSQVVVEPERLSAAVKVASGEDQSRYQNLRIRDTNHCPMILNAVCLHAAYLLGGSPEIHDQCLNEWSPGELEGYVFLRQVVASLVGVNELKWRPDPLPPESARELHELGLRQTCPLNHPPTIE